MHITMHITILMFIFSKTFAIYIFLTNLVPKSNVLQIGWNLIQEHIVTDYGFNV